MYVVIGATGHTGRVVAERLLGEGVQVRVVARDAKKLAGLAALGAEVRAGSVEDAGFLGKAFAGATAAYLMIPPNYAAGDFRAWQNRVGEALAAGLVEGGVGKAVNLSSLGADLPARTGPVLGLHDQEERLNALAGVDVLHLRAAYFMENLLAAIPVIRFMGQNASPLRADVAVPMIATRDIGREAAAHLLALDFKGHTVRELLGQRDLTMAEVTAIFGRAIGRPDLAYTQVSYTDAESAMASLGGMSPDVAVKMVELNRAMNEGRAIVGTPRTPANTTPTSIEEFAPLFAAAFNR